MLHGMNFRLCINGLLCGILAFFTSACQKPSGWAVYYGAQTPPNVLKAYGLVVIDRLYPFDIQELKEGGTQVIAYVSAGEVTVNDPWYGMAKEGGVLLHENPDWPGSFVVDLKSPVWHHILLKHVFPPLAARGFDGVMLDTLDSPLAVDSVGMGKAAVNLVFELRSAYPEWILIQNRGYAALRDTAPTLNYLLAESTFTGYDATEDKHYLRNQADQDYALNYINEARAEAPALRVLGLEYWDPEDKKTTALIVNKLRKNNFLPFISTRMLNQLHPQPR